MDKRQLTEYWMGLRCEGASREELVGFIKFPMHPKMVELAIEEIERRVREEVKDGVSCGVG